MELTTVDCLCRYKDELINVFDPKVRKFVEEAIPRWYFNVKKADDHIMPAANMVIQRDIEYARDKYGPVTDEQLTETQQLFERYSSACATASNTYEFIDVATDYQLRRLQELYTGPEEQFENDRNKLLHLYRFIGITNIHLSMPPIFYGVELFGSPLNTHNPFCSPFELEKDRFGSLGSFFDYSFHQAGLYLCNPPFDELLIERMAEHLEAILDATKFDVVVLITIPVWDSASQRKLKIKDYGLDFVGFDMLIKSLYFQQHKIISKHDYKYYDYYLDKKSPVTWTHVIVLSNSTKKYALDNFLSRWHKWSAA
jgi:hypothetical protein